MRNQSDWYLLSAQVFYRKHRKPRKVPFLPSQTSFAHVVLVPRPTRCTGSDRKADWHCKADGPRSWPSARTCFVSSLRGAASLSNR